ncbi:MAG: hypothetical protein J6336_12900 [Kiritimatiellae bacterium]|nr:hypothetical protein [Kiritimatiellia bacterium]
MVTGRNGRRAGQAVVFILLTLVILIFFLLFIVDLHRIIQRKDQAQNAGDAAALAAARWQGATLNLIGELNLMHALALTAPDPAAVHAITSMQARLCFTGPLAGLLAAQVAAKNNRIYVNNSMTTLLEEHAATIRTEYAQLFEGGDMTFQEPWPGAWQEYADLINQIASDGIAAGPDNMRFYQFDSDHILLRKDFYQAVDGYGWCWFYWNAYGLLRTYSSYRDWPPLPEPTGEDYANSEIFGLSLVPFTTPIQRVFSAPQLADYAANAGFPELTAAALTASNAMDRLETWFFYNPSDWDEWSRMKPDGEDSFPVTGPVRHEYDVAGADAIVRVGATVDRMTPNIAGGAHTDSVTWSSAAKPFGYLETDTGKEPATAAAFFVLPAFRHVRLIPVDAASGAQYASADADWVRHIRGHLHAYLETGRLQSETCAYCRTLAFWDQNPVQQVAETVVGNDGTARREVINKPFRQIGIDWLEEFKENCRRYSSGGGRGGGTRRGH